MCIQRVFGHKAPLERRIIFTVIAIILAVVDIVTERYDIVIDLAWISVLLCGLPIVLQSISTMVEKLEFQSNFLTSVALIALISIGDYHDAAYISILFQVAIIIEQWASPRHSLVVDDNWQPTLGATLHEVHDHLAPWTSVVVVASIFASIGSFALTRDLTHTITLFLVLSPSVLGIVVALYQLTHLVGNAPHVATLDTRDKQFMLFGALGSIVLFTCTIIGAVLGVLDPVSAVAVFVIARCVSLLNVSVAHRGIA